MNSKNLIRRWRKLYHQPELRFGRATLLAAVCVALATSLRLPLTALGATLAFATYFPAVLFAALIGGRVSGLLAIPLSLVAAWWAVYDPQFAFGTLNRVLLADFVLFGISAGVIVIVALMHRATVFELEDREQKTRLLAGEVRHRSANLLTVVFGLVRQSFRDPADAKKLIDRINASVATDGLLDEASGGPIALKEVIREVVDRPHPGRVIIDGADPTIDQETAKGLRLALHEMTTNALKYGALSEEKGRIIVRSQIGEGGCKIEWLEQDGPKVTAPAKFKFGSRLIKQSLAQIHASLDAEYADDGYRYVIMLPTNDRTQGRY